MDNTNNRALDIMRKPTLIVPNSSQKLKLTKHSLTDWDFEPDMGLFIDNALFVSAPSSLAIRDADRPTVTGWTFLKAAIKQNLPIGRFLTYHRTAHAAWQNLRIFFRTQAYPTNEVPDNCYYIWFGWANNTKVTLFEVVAGVENELAAENLTYVWNLDQWYHYRVTWYIWINASLDKVLRVIVETEIAGDWVEQLSHDIADPRWEDSATNLIGFEIRGSHTTRSHNDDTEIWEPVV